MRGLRRRYPALVLLLALLGGGFGLPLADAFIFHGLPSQRPAAERILSSGPQAATHVQICSLEQSASTTKGALPSPVVQADPIVATAAGVSRPTTQPAPQSSCDTTHSRAPPSA